jgi:hypothetical protein
VTDQEIKTIVRKYIIAMYESDNADCLHEMDEFWGEDDEEQALGALDRAYELYRTATVTVTWPDDQGDGGVREPRGDSPDPEVPGEPGLPGDSGKHFSAGTEAHDSPWPCIPAYVDEIRRIHGAAGGWFSYLAEPAESAGNEGPGLSIEIFHIPL